MVALCPERKYFLILVKLLCRIDEIYFSIFYGKPSFIIAKAPLVALPKLMVAPESDNVFDNRQSSSRRFDGIDGRSTEQKKLRKPFFFYIRQSISRCFVGKDNNFLFQVAQKNKSQHSPCKAAIISAIVNNPFSSVNILG